MPPIPGQKSTAERRNDLSIVLANIDAGVSSDKAVCEYPMEIDDAASFVPECYLEHIPSHRRLDRGPAASLLDLYARSTADVFSAGSRPSCLRAAKLEASAGYQRLGHRNSHAYATEELGLTGRSFRDMARLGERMEKLPATRRAFLLRQITWTEAQIIGSIATPNDEGRWLVKAQASTVRELKVAARAAREGGEAMAAGEVVAAGEIVAVGEEVVAGEIRDGVSESVPEGQEGSVSVPEDGSGPAAIDLTEPRSRCSLTTPRWMVGKLDDVSELSALVAGASVPRGTRVEYIAAELLSGTEAEVSRNDQPHEEMGAPRGMPPRAFSERGPASLPEDPNGYRRILEKESERWSFLPAARSPVVMRGSWSALAEECVALSREAGECGRGTGAGGGIGPGAETEPCSTSRLDGETRPDGETWPDPSSAYTGESAGSRENETPWSLHRKLKASLRKERTAAWQLGRLLRLIHDRRL